MRASLARLLAALHRDQRGADMVEYVLIIAAIALPLLGVMVYFWGDIKEWIFELIDRIKGDVDNAAATP